MVASRRATRAPTIPIADKLEEDKSDWRSLHIVNAIALLVAIEFSFFITPMYPYLKDVCHGELFMGERGAIVSVAYR